MQWFPARIRDVSRRYRLAREQASRGTPPERERCSQKHLYKAELIRGPDQGPWKIEDVELATLSWGHWFNTQRIHSHLNDIPPADCEDAYHAERSIKQRVESQQNESPTRPERSSKARSGGRHAEGKRWARAG